MTLLDPIGLAKAKPGFSTLDAVADGYAGFALARASAELAPDGPLLFVARDGQRLPSLRDVLAFASPETPVLELPAWDCLPYDRVSPSAETAARRLEALAGLVALRKKPHRAIILATANALLQRVPPADLIAAQGFFAKPGNQVDMKDLTARGEGELLGTRQSGMPGFQIARLDLHSDLLETARDDAKLLLTRDPELASPRGQAVRILLHLFGREEAVRLLDAG